MPTRGSGTPRANEFIEFIEIIAKIQRGSAALNRPDQFTDGTPGPPA